MNVVIPTPDQRQREERPEVVIPTTVASAIDLWIEAVETIPQWAPVTFDGRLARCQVPRDIGRMAGVATVPIAAGQRGSVRNKGLIVGAQMQFPSGMAIFVGDGRLAIEPPAYGWSQQVGVVLLSGELFVHVREPVLL